MQIESLVGGVQTRVMLVWRKAGHEFMHEHEREHSNAFRNVAF